MSSTDDFIKLMNFMKLKVTQLYRHLYDLVLIKHTERKKERKSEVRKED